MAFADFIEKEDGSFVLTGSIFQVFESGVIDENILFMTLDSDGCFYPNCEDLQLITQVHIAPQKEEQLKTFPNPFSETLNIQLPTVVLEKDFLLEVYNNVGQLLFSKKIKPTSDTINITFPFLPKRTYLLKVSNSSWSDTQSIIKQ